MYYYYLICHIHRREDKYWIMTFNILKRISWILDV